MAALQTWQRDLTGKVYIETSPGIAPDLGTGKVYSRLGGAWTRDDHGKMHFTYAGQVGESRKNRE